MRVHPACQPTVWKLQRQRWGPRAAHLHRRSLALFRRRNLADGGQLPHSAGEHRQILKAIASGDPEAAGRAMFDHVIESKERMLDGEAARTTPARARAGKKG